MTHTEWLYCATSGA